MGVRIDMENKIELLDRRLKLVEGAVEDIIKKVDDLTENNTRVHHVDLHDDVKESPIGAGFAHKDTKSSKKKDKEEKVSV